MTLYHKKFSVIKNRIAFSVFSSCSFIDKRDVVTFVLPDDFLLKNNLCMKAGRNRTKILTLIKKPSTRNFSSGRCLLLSFDVLLTVHVLKLCLIVLNKNADFLFTPAFCIGIDIFPSVLVMCSML